MLFRSAPKISIDHALIRGRYMKAVARMESVGIPVDLPLLDRLQANWESIQDELISVVDQDFGVYEGRTFKTDLFAQHLNRNQMAWPRLASGNLDLQDKTFRSMAKSQPQIAHFVNCGILWVRCDSTNSRLAQIAVTELYSVHFVVELGVTNRVIASLFSALLFGCAV